MKLTDLIGAINLIETDTGKEISKITMSDLNPDIISSVEFFYYDPCPVDCEGNIK